ncbi:unnamed protein product [Rotaria sordida]|uniref:Aldehyde dehydrogenase domain-containing protein n=1 Tax=Rotaria sordida TaxID=392033 RepID=A0A819VWZ1_9BILA|nr:unnamed protein product [Rotaria sordida]
MINQIVIKYTQIFINNEWHKATNGKTFSLINPSTGEEICQVEEGIRADVDKAVEGAQTAFDIESSWHKLDPLSFSQHKSICRKWKHLTMLIALKPTEKTALSALYCAALIKETGFPPDVVNIIPEYLSDGPECGYAIAVHAHIDKAACTSPVEVGKKIQEAATTSNLKCVTFELGQFYNNVTVWIFGPVMPVLKYDSYEEVIKRANDTTFGLDAGVTTRDIRRGLTLAHQIRPGSIWINTYKTICDQALFDGFKQSGQEKELGRYGLEAYYQSDPDKATEAAEKGFQYDSSWRKLDPAAHAQLIHKLADSLLRVVDYLATIMLALKPGSALACGNVVILKPAEQTPLAALLCFCHQRIDVPVQTAHRAVFTHAGQVCFAASKVFVHSTLHDAFVSKSVELAKARLVGDPFNSTTGQGP